MRAITLQCLTSDLTWSEPDAPDLEDELEEEDAAAPAAARQRGADAGAIGDFLEADDDDDEFNDFIDDDIGGGAGGALAPRRRRRLTGLPAGVSAAAMRVRKMLDCKPDVQLA